MSDMITSKYTQRGGLRSGGAQPPCHASNGMLNDLTTYNERNIKRMYTISNSVKFEMATVIRVMQY